MTASGIVIAGTHSGVGKTTITLAVLAALSRKGLRVAPFKVGPDFIDPGHHHASCGRPSRNLDGWMLGRDRCFEIFTKATVDADFAVVEGVMGLFDGAVGNREDGSAAEMAKWLGLPVVLVVDAEAMARSAAAVVKGFAEFDPDLHLAGVIFNRIGGPGHLEFLREAMTALPSVKVLGGLPRDSSIGIPERHLGLVTAEDHHSSQGDFDRLADWLAAGVDLESLAEIARSARAIASPSQQSSAGRDSPHRHWHARAIRIAIARDHAFSFYYPDNLELMERLGAKLTFFSPINDQKVPASDLIYIGGGYPELHASLLSENHSMRHSIRAHAAAGGFVYAECGGFMYLCHQLTDLDGRTHPMVGLFPFSTKMSSRLTALGYREVTALAGNPLFADGVKFRGHLFHHSQLVGAPEKTAEVYTAVTARGTSSDSESFGSDRVLAGYLHLHFLSNPDALADAFRRIAAESPL